MQIEIYNDDLEAGIRGLKRMLGRDGIHSRIKFRLSYIKRSEKRKAKQALAAKRRIDAAKRKARGLNRRNNVYDYIKKQDQANRLFVIRRAIDPIGRNQEDGKVS